MLGFFSITISIMASIAIKLLLSALRLNQNNKIVLIIILIIIIAIIKLAIYHNILQLARNLFNNK